MNLYKRVPIFTGTSLISTLAIVNSAWAGIEAQPNQVAPAAPVIPTTSNTPNVASPTGFATPDRLVKQLALNTIRQSDLAIRAGNGAVNQIASSAPPSAVAPRTQKNYGTLPRPSRVVTTCPAHICPPVNPVAFTPNISRDPQSESKSIAAKQPSAVAFNPTHLVNPLPASPSATKPSAAVAPAQFARSSTSEISGNNMATGQSQVFSADRVLNLVNSVAKNLDLNNIGQRLKEISGIDRVWRGDSASPDRQLFLPTISTQPQWLKVDPVPGYQYSPRLTLGGHELASRLGVNAPSPVQAKFEGYLLGSANNSKFYPESYLLSSIKNPQSYPLAIGFTASANRL